MSALIVNLFGGPGSGKSTLASGVFYNLKKEGLNCEFVHEFAKELTWEERTQALRNQLFILGNQVQMLERCANQVDVIITDTSILYGIFYARKRLDMPAYREAFEGVVLGAFNSMNNLNFYVERVFPYQEVGRYQNEDDANDLADHIRVGLAECHVPFVVVSGNDTGMLKVVEDVKRCLEKESISP